MSGETRMLTITGREIIRRGVAVSTEARGRQRMRRLGWVAVLFFTLKGLAWLAAGAGAWRLLR
jgi:hypothetical protein